MRPFASTISIDEARRRLAAGVRPIERVDWLPISEASGRLASADIRATVAVPPFTRSAMDGYAVVAADTTGAAHRSPVRLRVVDRVHTGDISATKLTSGCAMEIATGAPLPDGADAVVMVEETSSADDGLVDVRAPAVSGQHLGRQGADIAPGDVIVRHGDLLNAARIGALAAVGCAELAVYARPRVAVLSTGNEIVVPGATLPAGHVFDVNRFTLASVIAAHGGTPELHDPVRDDLNDLHEALDRCADADIIVFSGGSSVGDRDLVADLIAARGQMIFHGVAVKPGKPTAFARVGDTAFFGMPGNPTSCLTNAYVLLVPFLRATARLPLDTPRTVRVPLASRIATQAGRHQFYTVRLEGGQAFPAFKGSGAITSLSRADGYIEIPAEQSTVEEGALVEVTML